MWHEWLRRDAGGSAPPRIAPPRPAPPRASVRLGRLFHWHVSGPMFGQPEFQFWIMLSLYSYLAQGSRRHQRSARLLSNTRSLPRLRCIQQSEPHSLTIFRKTFSSSFSTSSVDHQFGVTRLPNPHACSRHCDYTPHAAIVDDAARKPSRDNNILCYVLV
jgi:hypothetical protein